MAMALHTLADHLAFENVEGCEQGGGAMSLVVVREGCGAALFHRQAPVGSGGGPGLSLFANRQNDGGGRGIFFKAHDRRPTWARTAGDSRGRAEARAT